MNIKKTILKIPVVKSLQTAEIRAQYKALEKKKRNSYETHHFEVDEDDKRPLVSVIIFVESFDKKPERLFESLDSCKFYNNVEYIIVNYLSSTALNEYLTDWKEKFDLRIVNNDDNLSYSGVNNRAADIAKGEYLVFLNSAVIITDGWLDELLMAVNNNVNVGAVGARMVYTDVPVGEDGKEKSWRIYHAGIGFRIINRKNVYCVEPYNLGNGSVKYEPESGCAERVSVTDDAFIISRADFAKVGGYDERYKGYYQDVDLCLKLKNAGYNNYYCSDCVIYYNGIDDSVSVGQDSRKIKKQDSEVLKGRWQRYLFSEIIKEKLAETNSGHIFVEEKHLSDKVIDSLTEDMKGYVTEKLDDKSIDICGAMPDNENTKFWGDYHYAVALKREFEKRGYKANILSRENWYNMSNAKYVLVLRGVKEYYPSAERLGTKDGNINSDNERKYIMWNISHPADVNLSEYEEYDYVFLASEQMQRMLKDRLKVKTGVLPQCTDPEVMKSVAGKDKRYELLFVGNSRKVFRRILKDLLPTSYNLTVYGRHWEEFPVQEYVVQDYIDNNEVGQAYHDAKILLNDHWDDMREYGIISNRIFDAFSAGAFVISDEVPGMEELLEGNVVTYTSPDDLKEKIAYYMEHDEERDAKSRAGQKIVRTQHTFANRVENIINVMQSL